jgi:hypothetical protein
MAVLWLLSLNVAQENINYLNMKIEASHILPFVTKITGKLMEDMFRLV